MIVYSFFLNDCIIACILCKESGEGQKFRGGAISISNLAGKNPQEENSHRADGGGLHYFSYIHSIISF